MRTVVAGQGEVRTLARNGARRGSGEPGSGMRVTGNRGAAVLLTLAAAGLVAGCSSGPSAGASGTSCGTTRTGANVPVVIKVTKGNVDCATVLRIEQEYAAAIRNGTIKGNGGGAPVRVDGWTCQGYPTPDVLRTGNASECHTASAEVVAVVALPSSAS